MKTLEVIHLRSGGAEPGELQASVAESLAGLEGGAQSFACYRRVDLGTDLAIHILRDQGEDAPRKSDAGLRLAQSLKQYGIVEHTAWEELDAE